MDSKPCTKCNSSMVTRRARAFSEYGGQDIYYFLDCSSCGHGPTIAFSSKEDAISHWNALHIPATGSEIVEPETQHIPTTPQVEQVELEHA